MKLKLNTTALKKDRYKLLLVFLVVVMAFIIVLNISVSHISKKSIEKLPGDWIDADKIFVWYDSFKKEQGIKINFSMPLSVGTISNHSDSMTPTFNSAHTIIYFQPEPKHIALLDIGDIILFKSTTENGNRTNICHRIVDVNYIDGEKLFLTKGDSNYNIDQKLVKGEDIIAVIVGILY